jgi:uncharacterized protein (UPF0276 family)
MVAVEPLGIGFPYMGSMPADFYQSGVIDFVEITPETPCQQQESPHILLGREFERARSACWGLPTVVHGVGLSIGSAGGCNTAYLQMLDAFQSRWPFLWHSEHLGFNTIAGDGKTLEAGLPPRATREVVELVAARSCAIGRRYGVPFLLENPAYYIPNATVSDEPEIVDNMGLMRQIMAQSGCYQLLDLHNIYCNALNHRLDPLALIDRVPLERVVEIHIAGGSWRDGLWTAGHDARVPPPVWRLLEYTLRKAPNVAGVVFDFLDQFAPRLGREAITEELQIARAIWGRYHPARRPAARGFRTVPGRIAHGLGALHRLAAG